MYFLSRRVTLGVLLVTGVLVATGCGKSRPKETTLNDTLVTGSWIEVPPKAAAPSARVRSSAPQEFLRHITVNADKTFVFSLRTLDGKPTKDDKKVEGTWELNTELNLIEFTVGNNPFKTNETGHDWVPETMSQLGKKDVPGKGMTEVIFVSDLAGGSAKLMREN
jgi:hypothetical protein